MYVDRPRNTITSEIYVLPILLSALQRDFISKIKKTIQYTIPQKEEVVKD